MACAWEERGKRWAVSAAGVGAVAEGVVGIPSVASREKQVEG